MGKKFLSEQIYLDKKSILNFKVNSAGRINQTRKNARRTKDKKMKHQETLNRIAALDAAIHNPARLMIVYLLSRQGALDYLTLMRETQLSSGNLTTHLNTLAGQQLHRDSQKFPRTQASYHGAP